MDYKKVVELMAKKSGLRFSHVGGCARFVDECGCEERATTEEKAAKILFDDIEAGGIGAGRRQARDEIVNFARLI